jgi:hypothetical protein
MASSHPSASITVKYMFLEKTNSEQDIVTSIKILCYLSSQAVTGHYSEEARQFAD